jgi:putative nucleotidyltransferase with HDIG domain
MNAICQPPKATEATLDTYLDHIDCLPPTPTVLVKLIDMFRQPNVDVDDIVQMLRRDPALAAEVLRRCNNSFLGDDTSIQDINEAVYRLGFYEVYQITVHLFGTRALTAPKVIPGFPAEELRQHSSIAAIAAGALARQVGVPEGIAFTTGLLHDVGKLVLALAEPARYVTLMATCSATNASVSQAEMSTFGFDHCEIGAHLLRRWGLPPEIVLPILGHNSPDTPGDAQGLTIITQAASEMANHIQSGQKCLCKASPESQRLTAFFGLDSDQICGWEQLVRNKLIQMDTLGAA